MSHASGMLVWECGNPSIVHQCSALRVQYRVLRSCSLACLLSRTYLNWSACLSAPPLTLASHLSTTTLYPRPVAYPPLLNPHSIPAAGLLGFPWAFAALPTVGELVFGNSKLVVQWVETGTGAWGIVRCRVHSLPDSTAVGCHSVG